MKYYNYRIAPNLFRAIDYDLKSLIWLSFVKFGGKNEKVFIKKKYNKRKHTMQKAYQPDGHKRCVQKRAP